MSTAATSRFTGVPVGARALPATSAMAAAIAAPLLSSLSAPIATFALPPLRRDAAPFSKSPLSSSFGAVASRCGRRSSRPAVVVADASSGVNQAVRKMNLNEYMVTLGRPLGIRFAIAADGRGVFVHSLRRGGNAEKSRIVMVGDKLKHASNGIDEFVDITDLTDIERFLKEVSGSCSLVLERPFSPFPIHELLLGEAYDVLFNKGRTGLASWNSILLSSKYQPSSYSSGNSGFAIFSARLLQTHGWQLFSSSSGLTVNESTGYRGSLVSEVIGICSEEDAEDSEWAHGSFPLDEYVKALERAKGELYYNHSAGMQYSKITEQMYVGSCIQTENDVQTLSDLLGITAVLNFQSESERANWGINSNSINESCRQGDILMVNYPIREADSMDLRKKLPFCVGLLLRLIRKNHKIYITCTSGFDRSPACVIAYLHWVQDTPLHVAHKFITGVHSCRPDRAAIVWATWDLIALIENGKHDGPPTHSVCFIWNNGREGDEVRLVGDFTNNWKDTITAIYKGGSRYEVELRLPHGKYFYKFIVNGQWKHSNSLPTEVDEHGNVNNAIRVGDIARLRPIPAQFQIKDPTVVKVIERALTEDERFLLAYAARRLAFAICPIKLSPK